MRGDFEMRIQAAASEQNERMVEYVARLRQELDDCRFATYRQVRHLSKESAADQRGIQ